MALAVASIKKMDVIKIAVPFQLVEIENPGAFVSGIFIADRLISHKRAKDT